ncbi:hypothetical protein [Myceligenerans indicum]|uniref:Lipoprotein n=1 Tax=Myceligenerans indicum TaxID=2593663 RepID=A0ABS1LMR0_9MICO|nr:hypothetical protein [Myceligenerans indicum]MBL0887319.1 hypothetical protein [Myceligenerans indicum]
MSNSFSTPLRVGAVVLGVVVVVAAGLVYAYGPGEGRWVQGALGASPTEPDTSEPSPGKSQTASGIEPSPSGSPSPSTAAQIKAKNIADAKASLVEYYATVAEVANDSYRDWEDKLGPFWGTRSSWQAITTVYERNRESGIHTEGAAQVVSMTANKYEPYTRGSEEIVLDVCIDFGPVKTFDGDGVRIPRDASVPTRYHFAYGLRHQGVGSKWTLISEERNQEQEC